MSVKRYDWDVDHAADGPYRVESPAGEWVLATDYAAQSLELQAAQLANKHLHAAMDGDDQMMDAMRAELQAVREALELACTHIDQSMHGDNCYVSNHYEGDPGDRCNCGKESMAEHLRAALKPSRGAT